MNSAWEYCDSCWGRVFDWCNLAAVMKWFGDVLYDVESDVCRTMRHFIKLEISVKK